MKIGILTQPLHNNYGGLLQAYALQTKLKHLGHDALILDRHYPQPSRFQRYKSGAKRLVLKYVDGNPDVEVFPFQPSLDQLDIISRESRKFVRQHIKKTSNLYSTEELKREIIAHHFDAYIVGSDQVWRLEYSPCISNYFLDFLKDAPSVKRIAYAASFGVDHWHFKPITTQECKRLAQKFDAISVREASGVDLCKQYLEIDAIHVLDPTMLLDPDDYRALVLAAGEPKSTGNLMTYILDPTAEKTSVVRQVASALELQTFTVMPPKKLKRETQACIEECVFPPVTRWLRGYMDAKFVVADSFHGCVFAILFNIPFIAIGNQQRGIDRFVSLLRQFNLRNRLINPSTELSDELIHGSIDWAQVNQQRSILKEFSTDFLRTSLHSSGV